MLNQLVNTAEQVLVVISNNLLYRSHSLVISICQFRTILEQVIQRVKVVQKSGKVRSSPSFIISAMDVLFKFVT